MDMAPPAGSRFVHIKTLTYSSIFAFLNVYFSPFPVFLKPPVGGEPGARSLTSLLDNKNKLPINILFRNKFALQRLELGMQRLTGF